MKLIIDVGNSRTKVAGFEKDQIAFKKNIDELTISQLEEFFDDCSIHSAIISSVKELPAELTTFLKKYIENPVFLSHATPIPITNNYRSPDTLGNDRLAGVVGAVSEFPGHDILVIDAGTCITYDFIDSRRNYFGGGISPGISIRFQALNHFTGRLPLIDYLENNYTGLVGDDTSTSILSGVYNGIIAEVDGIIGEYKKRTPGLKTILTGGDLTFFEFRLKSEIFAHPNLILVGLNKILEYNA